MARRSGFFIGLELRITNVTADSFQGEESLLFGERFEIAQQTGEFMGGKVIPLLESCLPSHS